METQPLLHKPSYWEEYIPWYPDGCFGPYRSNKIGYSRRELVADMAIHVVGLVVGFAGCIALLMTASENDVSLELQQSLKVYCVSLMTMLSCSFVFNSFAWSSHIWLLQLFDHIGIVFLIAGSYTPIMTFFCCPRTLAFVWIMALVTFTIKASRSRFDVTQVHVPIFLFMGWCIVALWRIALPASTHWGMAVCFTGGVFYTVGLIPWATNVIEFHNAIWHVFVLAGSTCIFAFIYNEVAQPAHWRVADEHVCHGHLFGRDAEWKTFFAHRHLPWLGSVEIGSL